MHQVRLAGAGGGPSLLFQCAQWNHSLGVLERPEHLGHGENGEVLPDVYKLAVDGVVSVAGEFVTGYNERTKKYWVNCRTG